MSDLRKCYLLQKIILGSNFSRLLAIRQVTQLSPYKKVPGIDGKMFLTFTERFELNELLRLNYSNWYCQPLRIVSVLNKDGGLQLIRLPIVSDRVWQLLISYSIEPIYECFFHPHNFGFRSSYSLFDLQEFLSLNFSISSNGHQKRVFIFNFEKVVENFCPDLLLSNLVAPRGVKLGLFRTFNSGFTLGFSSQLNDDFRLNSLLANIVLDGINSIHASVRFGYNVMFILKPSDNEKFIFHKILSFLNLNRLSPNLEVLGIFSLLGGFNFLEWNYVYSFEKGLLITPNFENYQKFLFRVKRVLNNSNYGSDVKSSKLSPIIKEWRSYNRFCFMNNSRFSLFYLKKRAFKIFNKESRQDSYSVKKLLDKSFNNDLDIYKSFPLDDLKKSPFFGHFVFTHNFGFENKILPLNFKPFCIHCGLECSF